MKNLIRLWIFLITISITLSFLSAQPKYRTFNQMDLSEKKAKAGKVLSSYACFVFRNDSTDLIVNGLTARLNSAIQSIVDSGGFTNFEISKKGKVFTATGRTIGVGDSVRLCFNLEKKAPGSQANFWWWLVDGNKAGDTRAPIAGTYDPIAAQPNGGNVLEYIYKRIIHRPEGIVIGLPTDTPNVGWIRYMKADRKYFPHSGTPRCFDGITSHENKTKPFNGELKNPHVKKHNNHLLGELHALKLAIIANDSGVTEPLVGTPLGDLIYNDLSNPGDPCNGMTLREIATHVDSALTYCKHFELNPSIYAAYDYSVSRINQAFDGPYVAITFNPFVLAGTHAVEEYSFLHPNPSVVPMTRRSPNYSILDQIPEQSILAQNYPNPFNPVTTIEFSLTQPSIVTLKIYNLLGQEVASIISNEMLDEGEQSVDFDASNLTSGIYFYKIDARGVGDTPNEFHAVKRMVLLK